MKTRSWLPCVRYTDILLSWTKANLMWIRFFTLDNTGCGQVPDEEVHKCQIESFDVIWHHACSYSIHRFSFPAWYALELGNFHLVQQCLALDICQCNTLSNDMTRWPKDKINSHSFRNQVLLKVWSRPRVVFQECVNGKDKGVASIEEKGVLGGKFGPQKLDLCGFLPM